MIHYHQGGDHDLGATVAAQMREVCDRSRRRSPKRRWSGTVSLMRQCRSAGLAGFDPPSVA
jgi:hypothetical protein